MGKIISVWSSTKKTGKSVFLYVLVNHLSGILSRNLKILVCCANLNHGDLMDLFNIGGSELNIEDMVNYKIHPVNNGFNLISALAKKKNVYFTGSKKTSSIYINRNMRIFENLIEEFREAFDLVLIDTVAGNENSLTNMIIEKSDYVLNVINQDKKSLERCPFTTGSDLLYVVDMYRDIYPGGKELSSAYNLKNVFILPFCNELQEMKNRSKLEFYLQHDTAYNRSARIISDFIADKLGLELERELIPEKRKRGVLSCILGGFV